MAEAGLQAAITDIPAVRGVFITAMPDCLLYDMWMRPNEAWGAEDTATYFGDLIRANRSALKSLGSWSSEMQVTIESSDLLIILRELNEHFVLGVLFNIQTPLGMVRLNVKKLVQRILPILPSLSVEDRPRVVRALEFLERYAPDPHAVMMRVSLQTGISADQLENADALSAEDAQAVEDAVKNILGLAHLSI